MLLSICTQNQSKMDCDTVAFHPHLCKLPVLQPIEQAVIAANKLTTVRQNFEKQHAP